MVNLARHRRIARISSRDKVQHKSMRTSNTNPDWRRFVSLIRNRLRVHSDEIRAICWFHYASSKNKNKSLSSLEKVTESNQGVTGGNILWQDCLERRWSLCRLMVYSPGSGAALLFIIKRNANNEHAVIASYICRQHKPKESKAGRCTAAFYPIPENGRLQLTCNICWVSNASAYLTHHFIGHDASVTSFDFLTGDAIKHEFDPLKIQVTAKSQ